MELPPVVATELDLRAWIAAARRQGKKIGFVPTMGALHAGHLSLVEASRRECDRTVVSIFVNPTQFGPSEDFQRYPRDLDADLARLGALNVDLVFAPDMATMYGEGHSTFVEVAGLSDVLEGKFRPGHFRGVATIVLKLFLLVQPDVAYFGQKDYQQTLVVRRMVQDLNVPVAIRICPTVRESDGLPLSSRNAYLSRVERRQALAISRALRRAEEVVASGERRGPKVLAAMKNVLEAEKGLRLQYAVLTHPETLADVTEIAGPTLAAIAGYVGKTRLIDNVMLKPQ